MATARTAYATMIKTETKYQRRGYGARVIIINDCPDCRGLGNDCATCNNEPDKANELVKVNGKWYRKVTK